MVSVTMIEPNVYLLLHTNGDSLEIDLRDTQLYGLTLEAVIKARAKWNLPREEVDYLARLIRNDNKQWRRE